MKSHIVLLRRAIQEMGSWCCTSTELDWKTIELRIEDEGFSFLTITLPSFGKDFQKSLDLGYVDSNLFLSFKKRSCLPAFLQGFTSLVFNPSTGRLLDEPSIVAIRSVLQISYLFSKVEIPCSDTRNLAAIAKYIETDQEVKRADALRDPVLLDKFIQASYRLWDPIYSAIDKSIYNGDVVPKHGPGATADKLRGNAKFTQFEWTQRMEEVFPFGENLIPSWRYFNSNSDRVSLLEPGAERPVRVITVPKTLKTPRIIAIEPTCMQYMQQGIWEQFLTNIEKDDFFSIIVGFADQSLNRDMAKQGSRDGSLATLDLSEASDRVSNQLVRALFSKYHWLAKGVDATRSRKADVPGHGVIRLAKFASMGSALCFPVEAMVFTTIVFMAIAEDRSLPVNRELVKEYVGKVRIYGDDIIAPVEHVHSVISLLQAFGLVVNENKSFWTGKFRESCGGEYYDGVDVSYVKCRRLFPHSRKHVSELVSLVSMRNQLYKAGFRDTCDFLDNYIERFIPFPVVRETSPALGRHDLLDITVDKTCPNLQRPLVRAYRVVSTLPDSVLENEHALLKWFLKRGVKPFADRDHLRRAGRPDAVNIKLGWIPAY